MVASTLTLSPSPHQMPANADLVSIFHSSSVMPLTCNLNGQYYEQ